MSLNKLNAHKWANPAEIFEAPAYEAGTRLPPVGLPRITTGARASMATHAHPRDPLWWPCRASSGTCQEVVTIWQGQSTLLET